MPADLFYSTGQAARELGVSPATVRAWCASGSMEHQTTPGGQLRIPQRAVEKAKLDGPPAIPRPLPNDNPRPARKNGSREVLYGPASKAIAESGEAAVMSGHELQIARNRVEVLKLKSRSQRA